MGLEHATRLVIRRRYLVRVRVRVRVGVGVRVRARVSMRADTTTAGTARMPGLP